MATNTKVTLKKRTPKIDKEKPRTIGRKCVVNLSASGTYDDLNAVFDDLFDRPGIGGECHVTTKGGIKLTLVRMEK